MRFTLHSHRNALEIVEATPELSQLWAELKDAIHAINDEDLLAD